MYIIYIYLKSDYIKSIIHRCQFVAPSPSPITCGKPAVAKGLILCLFGILPLLPPHLCLVNVGFLQLSLLHVDHVVSNYIYIYVCFPVHLLFLGVLEMIKVALGCCC